MLINDLLKTKKAHIIVEFIFYSIYWTFKSDVMYGSDRTSKEADESPFFSPSAEIDICIPHRASMRLSCLFHSRGDCYRQCLCLEQ